MTFKLTKKRCPVQECGAMVLEARVDGQLITLNPVWVDVVVANEEGGLRKMRGLLPHESSCVDISARSIQRAEMAQA